MRDFLLLCFRKDPTQRATAKALLQHPWIRAVAIDKAEDLAKESKTTPWSEVVTRTLELHNAAQSSGIPSHADMTSRGRIFTRVVKSAVKQPMQAIKRKSVARG
jgi:serine/threonine protein kinase